MKRGATTLLVLLIALAGAVSAEAAPEDSGQWSAPQAWPRVAVHTSLLPTGKVLFWDGFEAGPNSQYLFDPLTGSLTAKPYARNLFCSGFSQLADGRLFIAGGHVSVNNGIKDSTLWDPNTSTATRVADLQNSRWYPTVTTLPDGRALVFSGDNITSDDTPPGNPLSYQSDSLPEIYNPTTNSYQRLTNARLTTPLYPFMFVLPDGRVFDAGPDPQTHLLDVSGNGTMSNGPVSPFDGSSAVMYAPGKVMKSGTWSDPSFAGRTVTGRTAVIDMNQPSPVWRETAPMRHPRSFETITSLPDGTSIVTGGTSRSDGVDMSTAVLPAEIWNPETETWTEMAAQVNGRGYHSTALLLPDGRVLSAGGGQLPGYPVVDQRNAEIFSPPYLFKGPRPTVLSAPSTVQHGSTFTVGVAAPESISKVSMVRLGSETHTFDQNQRYIPLNFTNTGGSLSVQAPANSSIAPPGYYMLFVLNGNGVPSMAEFVRMPAPNEDATAPTAPANLSATGGLGKVDLTWTASTDNGSIRRYNVHRSTTPGFTPTAANRVGQPTGTSFTDSGLAGGTYYYMVQAEDQAGNLSTPSAEATATATGDSTAPTVSMTAPADGATVQASVTVTATAADAVGVSGVQFKLDGANLGSEDTSAPYSVPWDTTAAANGAHSLSAVARDAAGNTRTATAVNVTVANTGPPPGAPVAAYGFDETSGATVADASGRNNTGSITGAVRTTTTAKYGGAITFDGVNDLITVPDSNSLDLTNGMTLEAWVRPTASGNYRTAIIKETTGNLAYALYSNSTAFGSSSAQRPSAWITSNGIGGTAALPTGAWAHLASTYDGVTWRFYLNGVQVAQQAFTGAIPVSNGALRIGGNNIWGEWFAGQLDEVRVYARALTPLEVVRDRDTPIGGPPPVDTTSPAVSVTAPADGATVAGSVNLTANASDDTAVSGVQFKLDGANLGAEDTSAPYSLAWDTRTASNAGHTLTAVARDAAGNTRTATTVNVTVANDATAPTVSLTAPADGATVQTSISVAADAADNVGVSGVQFKLDGANLGAEDTSAPYSVTWNTATAANGPHTLSAVARDAAGNTRTAATVNVTVLNDTTAPAVSLTAPAGGASLQGTVDVTADASDNVGVSGVQFRLDGANLGSEDTSAPYSVPWNTTTATNGAHALTALARDATGNTRTATTVNVTVANPDAVAPTVSLTAPADGATVQASVNVTANAADNLGVSGVQFKLDGANLGGEDTSAPYSVAWNTTTATNGPHTLSAVARDAAGNTTTATAVNVTVDNDVTSPTVSITAPTDGATVQSSVTVTANAADNVGVSGVQFKLDGANLGSEDTSSPYSIAWNTATATNGAHTLSAVARDAAANTRTATTVTVNVSNTGPPPGAPVAAYGFDEASGTGVTDASGRGNAGTIAGGAVRTTATAKFGGAITFDGVNDLISVPDANSLDLTNAMTLEAWVRPTASGNYRTVIIKETAGNLVYALYASSSFGGSGVQRPSAWIFADGLGPTTALPANTWSHIATTYDRTNWRFYVNGVQVATRAYAPAIQTSTGALRIGGNNIWAEWFAGQIDEVRLYDRALSAAEVAADRDKPVNP